MRDSDYFHLMVAVLLVLVMLVVAAVEEWQLRHPDVVRESIVYMSQTYP
jgi:hypothetical protein